MPCYPEHCDYSKAFMCQLHGNSIGPIEKAKMFMAYSRATRQARIARFVPLSTVMAWRLKNGFDIDAKA